MPGFSFACVEDFQINDSYIDSKVTTDLKFEAIFKYSFVNEMIKSHSNNT